MSPNEGATFFGPKQKCPCSLASVRQSRGKRDLQLRCCLSLHSTNSKGSGGRADDAAREEGETCDRVCKVVNAAASLKCSISQHFAQLSAKE